jgi:NADH:ubiquinone oxidoreductase subunit 2 (subunit N)
VLAIGSLLVGNLAAIAQTNLKRMLAYSTISQMGFVLLGLMSGVVNGNTLSPPTPTARHVLRRHLCADHAGHLRHHPAAGA